MNFLLLTSMSLEYEKTTGNKIHFLEVCKNMAATKNKIVLVAPYYKTLGNRCDYGFVDYQIELTDKNALNYALYHRKLIKQVKQIIKENKIDLIYSRDLINVKKITEIAHKNNIPHMIEINGLLDEEKKLTFMQKILLKRQWESVTNCDLIRVMTNQQKYTLLKKFPGKTGEIAVIPQGTDTEKYKDLGKKESRKKLGIAQDEFIFFFMGSFNFETYVQGLKAFIEAYARFIKQNKRNNLIFRLAGDGAKRNELENLCETLGIKAHVEFLGFVNNDEIPLHISASDICLQPWVPDFKDKEELSLKLPSYMACERRIILTDNKGFRDVTEGFDPILWDYEDANSMFECIEKAYSEKDSWDKGKEQRAYIVDNLTWKKMGDRILIAFENWKKGVE